MRTLAVVLLILLAPVTAGATVFLPADLGELSRDAYAVARGRIVAVETQWATPDRGSVETVVTMAADVWLKRDLGATVRFRVPGGRLGRYRRIVVGAPTFDRGQHVVVFLGAAPPALPYVLGLSQGVFRIVSGTGGPMVTPPAVLPSTGAPRRIVRGDVARRPMALAEFEQRVRALAREVR
jgi:hypothetical protein